MENVTGSEREDEAMRMHVSPERGDRDIAQKAKISSSKAIPLPKAGSIQENTTFKEGIRVSQSLTSKPQSPLSGAEKAVPSSPPHSEHLENATPPRSPLKKELGELQDKIKALEAQQEQIKDRIQKADKEYEIAKTAKAAAQAKISPAYRSFVDAVRRVRENEKFMKFIGQKMKVDIMGYLNKWKPETLNEIGAKEYMEMNDAAFQATINDLRRVNWANEAIKKIDEEDILAGQALYNALNVREQEMDRLASLKKEQEALIRLSFELQSESE